MIKKLFILVILIKCSTLQAQDWTIDLSYDVRDTIFSYYIDSDPTLIFYKDVNRTRDTREFSKIKISKERAKEILEAIQCIKEERKEIEENFGFRDDVEFFVTLVEKGTVTEFSFFDHQAVSSLTRLLILLDTCKNKKSIFVNFIHSTPPPPPINTSMLQTPE